MEWWEEYFGEAFCLTAIAMNLHAKREIDFILNKVEIPDDGRILDMCCGYGRHSLELAKRGYSVLGVDYSETLINKAQSANVFEDKLQFIKGDIRNYIATEKYDLVLNLFVSIGYFSSETENIKSVETLCNAVKKGGYLVLEINNSENIQEGEEITKARHGTIIKTERWYDADSKILHSKRKVNTQDNQKEYDMNIRIYTIYEIMEMCEKYNVRYVQHYNGYTDSELAEKSTKLVVILKKD